MNTGFIIYMCNSVDIYVVLNVDNYTFNGLVIECVDSMA